MLDFSKYYNHRIKCAGLGEVLFDVYPTGPKIGGAPANFAYHCRQNGLEAAVKKIAEDIPVFGICGGYQMLGEQIADPTGVEGGGALRGMELLPVVTELGEEKVRCQIEGRLPELD